MAERAARGLSDPGPIPRDVNAAAADIDAFVHAARIEGPLVLVGHSMASYHVRQYANLHKHGEVAGMVLVDPSGDGQTARFTEFIPNLAELMGDNVDDEVAAGCVKALREKLLKRDEPVAKTCGGNDPDRVEATTFRSRVNGSRQYKPDQGGRTFIRRHAADRADARRLQERHARRLHRRKHGRDGEGLDGDA